MTDQTPEDVVDAELVETEVIDAEVLGTETEPIEADVAEVEVVEAEAGPEAVALDLGDESPDAPVGTDFDVVATAEPTEATPAGDFELASPPAAAPVVTVEPVEQAAPTPAPAAPAPAAPTGGSFLDLPPLPDLNYPAPTPPPASPYPPPAPSYPKAANYPQTDYAPYPADYSQQVAGQAYGHGAPAAQPGPVDVPNPYGAPTGFGLAPYQQTAPTGDLTSASAAHWGALVANLFTGTGLGFLVPLIILQTTGKTDPFVRENAVQSLNFSLTMLLGMVVSLVLLLVFVGIVGLIVIPILTIILQILGSIAAGRGEVYRYPISIRFVK